MRIRSVALDPLLHQLRMGSGERYGELRGEWLKHRIMEFRYQFSIGVGKESWFFGVQPNKDSPSDYWTTCKVEFNPAKVGSLRQFNEFYSYLIANCKYLDFKRFDVAIDIPVPRSHVHMFKDARVLDVKDYGGEQKTIYLGTRLSHGNVKLYNKQRTMQNQRGQSLSGFSQTCSFLMKHRSLLLVRIKFCCWRYVNIRTI